MAVFAAFCRNGKLIGITFVMGSVVSFWAQRLEAVRSTVFAFSSRHHIADGPNGL